MQYHILTIDNPKNALKLHKKTKKIKDFNDPALLLLMQQMGIICTQEGVAGVAATQLGSNLAVFALSAGFDEETGDPKPPVFFFNPKIIEYSAETKEEGEGCLSVPGVAGFVERSLKVTIQWFDIKKKSYTQEFDGFWARAIQHECDHLNGVLYIDLCKETHAENVMQQLWEERNKLTTEQLLQAAEANVKNPLDLLRVGK